MKPRERSGGCLVLLAFLVACEPRSSASRSGTPDEEARFGAVVDRRIAALEAQLDSAAPAPPEPASDLVQEIESMVEMLTASKGSMREAVVEGVLEHGLMAMSPLRTVLVDETRETMVRQAAAELLGHIDARPAADVLIEAVSVVRDPKVRASIYHSFARLADDRELPSLLLRLRYESEPELSLALSAALAHMGSFAALEILSPLTWNPDRDLSARAEMALQELATRAKLESGEALWRRWYGPGSLSPHPGEPSSALELEVWRRIAQLGQEHFQLRGVDDARYLLSRLESWAVPWLAQALGDDDVYVRLHVAQVLERMGPRALCAAPALIEALRDPRVAAAAAAAEALGKVAPESASKALLPCLAEDRPYELRVAAVRALGHLGDRANLRLVRAVMDEASEPLDLRCTAARALTRLDDGRYAAPFLLERLSEEERSGADSALAEEALDAWLESASQAFGGPYSELFADWRALADESTTPIPSAAEAATRRARRAALLTLGVGRQLIDEAPEVVLSRPSAGDSPARPQVKGE